MKRFLSFIVTVALLLSLMPTGWFNITASAVMSDFAGGDGTESSPYLISTASQLSNVRDYLDAHFKLTCHIYISTSNWWPIGDTESEAFTGTFDGNGFCIDNLEMHSSAKNNDIAGLFGYNEGVIKNLCVSGSTVSASSSSINSSYISSSSYAGGIAGYNKGTITNCYNTVTIEASASGCGPMSYAGGIAGKNYGTITNCYNTGTVFASARNQASVTDNAWAEAGGIVGYNRGTIKNCYNIGGVSSSVSAVSPYAWAGGIAASNASTIVNCYYIDNIPNGGGSGKECTAEQLRQQSTYVGFDFENVWKLDASIQLYPTLKTTHYHIYENVCDSICDTCGHSRIPPHSYEWKTDKENNCAIDGIKHEECTICHIRRSENTVIEATGNHTFTDEKDTLCDVCEGAFYQITFNGNGGSDIERIITSPGSSITLPSKPTRRGYIFVGWATTQNGNAIYQPKATYYADTSITLYAQWNKACISCDGVGLFTCSSCDGEGTLGCKTCSGTGTVSVNCGTCAGTGNETYDCGVCDGAGKVNSPINCSKCSGYGWTCNDCGRGVSLLGKCSCGSSSKYYCSKCGGTSASNWVPCSYCSGTGERTRICSTCSGQKYKKCTNCYGYGTLEHSACDGTGSVTCIRCNGTGEFIRTDVAAPPVPILKSRTANSVTLNAITNGEYSIDAVTWQDSPIFENLETGKEYCFYQRYAKTDTTNASAPSEGLVVIPDHIYDNQCDTNCNLCGHIRTITHSYEWIVDQEETCNNSGVKHEECVVCRNVRNADTTIPATGVHTFDNACDIQCNICGIAREATHNFEWVIDKENNCGENGVKHEECTVCHATQNVGTIIVATANHVYDNVCDATCNICGDVRIVPDHEYDAACDATCNLCGANRTAITHTYDSVSCVVCGYTCEHVIDTYGQSDTYNLCKKCKNYGICGPDSTFVVESDGTAIISGTGAMYGYVDMFAPLSRCRIPVESVIILQGITSIGYNAFFGCYELTSVQLPNSVTNIDGGAFHDCSNLTSITIPDSITSIDSYAFSGCSSLISITIPESVTCIGSDAFRNCTSLTTVNFNAINCADMPSSYYSSIFYGCSNLKTVIIGENVTKIPSYAFSGCSGLTSVTIPNSVTSIDQYAFDDCSLTTIVYCGTQAQWDSVDISSSGNGPLFDASLQLHSYEDGSCIYCQSKCIFGDLTGDGKINSLDGLLLMRYLNGWDVNIASPEAMDVNGDGKVNSLDGLILMRYLNGWNVTLG